MLTDAHVYEVRCERCQTSFAPETKRCLHCGGPLHSGHIVASRGAGTASGEPASGPLPDDPDEAQEELMASGRGRGLFWLLTAALAIAGSAVRTCQGG